MHPRVLASTSSVDSGLRGHREMRPEVSRGFSVQKQLGPVSFVLGLAYEVRDDVVPPLSAATVPSQGNAGGEFPLQTQS